MSHKDRNTKKTQTRRPLSFVLLGILLFATAALLIVDRVQNHASITPPAQTYHYDTHQSFDNNIHYQHSSFFSGGPGQTDGAYLSDLTNSITAGLRYNFNATDATDLSYTYGVKATVQSVYGSRSETDAAANVWSQEYTLLAPVHGVQRTAALLLTPHVDIPYTQYKQKAEQFKNAFSAAVTSEAVVTFDVRVSGKFNDTPFEDTKTSTITLPLDQEVYKPSTQFTARDHHDVMPENTLHIVDLLTHYEAFTAAVLIIGGMVSMVYGIRKQIVKSPHQRELEKIYRYHDGIIIKASHLNNLDNKNVVMVQSFEDLLNLEEEIKTPIIASKASDVTTHFFITRDDLVYVYTLGAPAPFKPPTSHGHQPDEMRDRY